TVPTPSARVRIPYSPSGSEMAVTCGKNWLMRSSISVCSAEAVAVRKKDNISTRHSNHRLGPVAVRDAFMADTSRVQGFIIVIPACLRLDQHQDPVKSPAQQLSNSVQFLLRPPGEAPSSPRRRVSR